jgi:hypothetical protein
MFIPTVRRAACAVFVLGLGLTAASGAYAGGSEPGDESHTHQSGQVCGSQHIGRIDHHQLLENTALHSPDVYRAMLAHDKMSRSDVNRALSSADSWDFFVSNQATGQYSAVAATKVWEGTSARIWVDNADRNNASRNAAIMNVLPSIARAIDSATGATSRNSTQGIVSNDIEVFGPTPTTFSAEWEGKTNFLLTDIKDGLTGGFVGGYFSPNDQTEATGSNRMNLLVIDSKEGVQNGATALASTIAHEFQHLIHYGLNQYSEIMINEGCSEVASILNGYRDRSNTAFLANTNVDLFRWSYDNGTLLLADYERAMTFVHYLHEQYGEAALTELARSRAAGVFRLNEALKKSGSEDDYTDVLKNFAVANYLQRFPADTRYGYTTRLSGSTAKVGRSYTGASIPTVATSLTLESYGSSYVMYQKPLGTVKLSFSGGSFSNVAVMAITYHGSEITVSELQKGRQYTFGENGLPDRIVFAYVNLGNGQVEVETSTSVNVVAGVEDENADAFEPALLAAAPNPVNDASVISFASRSTEPLTLSLYDAQGSVVRMLIDGERHNAGVHQIAFESHGLPAGWYFLRLRQGGREVSRGISIVR